MTQRRFLWLLLAALAVIAAALILNGRRHTAQDASAPPLFPGLGGGLNRVTAVAIRKGGAEATTVLRQAGDATAPGPTAPGPTAPGRTASGPTASGPAAAAPAAAAPKTAGRWVVAERNDYPADLPKLRKLLIALGDAVLREEKTSNPANYARIGVDDPGAPGATGAEIAVSVPDATLRVIVGKPAGNGVFVRRTAEARSYLAEPAISFETEPRYWIDPRITTVPLAAIRSIEIKPADGPGYALRRSAAGGDAFTLAGVPAGRSALAPPSLAPSPATYAELTALDVAQAGDIDFSRPVTSVITLSDGNVVTLTGAAIGDKRWITVSATQDAPLNAKAGGRAYEISSDRYAALFRPLEQLLQPKAAPQPKAPPLPKPPARPAPQSRSPSPPSAAPTPQPPTP